MLTREFLVKTKCLLVASWTVKIAPVLESSFSGFLQDLIRLKKKIDDICDCKLLNGQTGTIQFGKVGKINVFCTERRKACFEENTLVACLLHHYE